MILKIIQLLLINLFAPKRSEPVRLAKKKEVKAPIMDRTFILIALALALFFAIMLISAVMGMSYTESGQLYNMVE